MILGIIFVLIAVIIYWNCYWKRQNLPPGKIRKKVIQAWHTGMGGNISLPQITEKSDFDFRKGPCPIPILGNAVAFALEPPPNYFVNWTKQYGDIYTFWAGEMPIVCVNDVKTITEKFVKEGEIFAGRGQIKELFEITRHGQQGIIFEEGDPWRTHRRFVLRVFRDFGFGKNLMQEKIMNEFVYLMETVREKNDEGVRDHSIQDYVDLAVGSVINSLLFGFRCSENKVEDFKKQKAIIGAVIKDFGNPAAVVMIHRAHIWRFVPFFSQVYYRMIENRDKTWEYFRENVEKRKASIDFDADTEAVDYVEAFLRKQREAEKSGEEHYFTDKHLYSILWDLWFAGQETTSNTIAWACVYLIKNQKCQKRLQEEFAKVINSDRLISIEDKPNLPYLNAVIAESQRCANLLNSNVIHRTLEDTTIHGYQIPKHTVIINQISSVLYDERYFPEPYSFKPERYLSEDGAFEWPEALMPFGVGKRACLGESLARMELFLFIANLFNQFELSENPEKPIDDQRYFGGTISPAPYTCIIKERSF